MDGNRVATRFFEACGGVFVCLLISAVGCGPNLGGPTTSSGKVTVDGQPLSGATVILHSTEERPAEFRTFRTTTDANGQYKVDKIYPGSYEVVIVEAPGKDAKGEAGMASAIPDLQPASGDKLQVQVKPEQSVSEIQLTRKKAKGGAR